MLPTEQRNTCRKPREVTVYRTQECPGTLAGETVKGVVVREYLFREHRDPQDATEVIEYPINGDGSWNTAPPHTPQPDPRAVFCKPENFPPPEGPESDVVVPWVVDDCPTAHAGKFEQGSRSGFERKITYPRDWPVDDLVIGWIVDECFRLESSHDNETRPGGSCPTGHSGTITQSRRVTNWVRVWADPRRETTPSHTTETEWAPTTNTCRPEQNDGGGGSDRHSIDVDGDLIGDYRNERDANQAGYTEDLREVYSGCGACNGPSRPDNGPQSDGDTDSPGADRDGCFLTTAIVERRGEADDGPTLTALRAFRDGWMAQHPDGPALVRDYYDIAPRIVAAIPDDHVDWTWIGDRIDEAVTCLGRDDPEGAFAVYTAMVRRLKAIWLEEGEAPMNKEGTPI